MADLLSIGKTGLLAYQQALSTVSHNITNVNTDGYTRQKVDLSTQPPQFNGAGYEGTGVKIAGVRRIYDQFLETQLTTNLSAYRQQESFANLAGELDSYLADPNIGLSPVLQNYFKALQDISTNPSSTPVRQVLLSEAQTLASVFHDGYRKLEDLKNSINIELNSSVTQINNLASAIADVNKDILFSQGGDSGFPPNDLLDQRQKLLNELAEIVGVKTVEQNDGTLNVFIGSGQSLVIGLTKETLAIAPSEFDPTRYEVGLSSGGSVINISDQVTGGSLGGALAFRNEVLDPAYDQYGQVALTLSEDVNTQHQLGIDMNNQFGGNFFTDLTSVNSIGSSLNAASTDYVFTSTVTDSNLIKADRYKLDFIGGTYSLTRLSDNTVVGSSASLATLSSAVSASEGFSIAQSSGATISSGDSFLIAPVKTAARDMGVSISDPSQVAAAVPLVFSANAANTGSTSISNDSLVQRTGTTLPAAPIDLTFNSGTNTFSISTGGTIAYNPVTDSGNQYTLTIAGLGDYQFTISGVPGNGDVMSLSANTNGHGDNRNIQQMISLQTQKLVNNGSSNYQESYAELVASVGVRTKRAEFSSQANQVLYERAFSSQQAVSGVNLDEEAANLIKFQQSYQAVARVITVADELFQTILGAVSR